MFNDNCWKWTFIYFHNYVMFLSCKHNVNQLQIDAAVYYKLVWYFLLLHGRLYPMKRLFARIVFFYQWEHSVWWRLKSCFICWIIYFHYENSLRSFYPYNEAESLCARFVVKELVSWKKYLMLLFNISGLQWGGMGWDRVKG